MLTDLALWAPALLALSGLAVACARQQGTGRPAQPFAAMVGPVIIAHRGGSLEAPENTLGALRRAIALGADWQEIDVTLSKDGEVVVIHDDTLERTTDGEGYVEKLPWSELKKLSTGRPALADYVAARLMKLGVTLPDFGDTYASERIPLLREVLALEDARLMIELKATTRVEELAQKVVDLVHEAGAEGRVALGSFETPLLEAVHLRDSALPLIGIAEDAKSLEKKLELPLAVVAVSTELASEAMLRVPTGVAVWTWTVYTPEAARELAELGVHGLITDVPQAVLGALRREE